MAGTTELLSVDPENAAGNDSSENAAISADGRIVAFSSIATNLVANDTNDFGDIFVRDWNGGETELISVGFTGDLADADSYRPAISGDGRFVAFESQATNLVVNDTNEADDVFVRDRQTGTTIRVSVDSAGNEGNSFSTSAAISADGRFVAFDSGATNLVVGDTNGFTDIFVRDLVRGTTERVSVASDGGEGNANSSSLGSPPSISADGRFVAFESFASNLVEGDTNGSDDVFVHDRETGTTVRISVDADGNEGTGASFNPAISADGRFVAFVSISALVPGDDNFAQDIFVKELATGAIERVSISATGEVGDDGSFSPAISADGRFVAFASGATNLVPGDSNDETDVFVADRETGSVARISVGTEGQEANNSSFGPALSADGALAAFQSFASNFGFEVGIGNGTGDVFLATTAVVPPPLVPPLPPLAEGVAVPDEAINGVPREALTLTAGRDAAISFVDEYAGFQNSLGVYLVGPDGQIIQPRWVFERIEHALPDDSVAPSVRPGGGPSQPGDPVWLSDLYDPAELKEGTEFGLFLVADGGQRNPSIVFDQGTLEFRSGGDVAKVTDTTPELVHIADTGVERVLRGDIMHTVDAGSPDPLSNALNPPAVRYPVGGRGQALSGLLDDAFTIAFEDKPVSQSDRDFNDLLVAVELLDSVPVAAEPAAFSAPAVADLQALVTEIVET